MSVSEAAGFPMRCFIFTVELFEQRSFLTFKFLDTTLAYIMEP